MNCQCGYYYIRHICYNCGSVDESNSPKSVWIPPVRHQKPIVIPNNKAIKKRKQIFERDGNKCLKCQFSPQDLPKGNKSNWLTIDHIIPKSKGGNNSYNNLQTLCRFCNHTKGNTNSNDYRTIN